VGWPPNRSSPSLMLGSLLITNGSRTSASCIAGWIQEVQGERLAAQRQLARSVPSEPLSKADLRSLVGSVRDTVKMIAKADPDIKAEVYQGLGLRLEYRPAERLIAVEVPLQPTCTTARVGGPSVPMSTRAVLRGEFLVAS
jgi:hypothetical protein